MTNPEPAPGAASPAEPQKIEIGTFQQIEMRTGRILSARAHEKADKLLVLHVDIGEPTPRQIVAGIRADWEPDVLVGRTVIILANLKPAMLRGVESQGMVLAVRGVSKVIPLGVDGDVAPGTRVT